MSRVFSPADLSHALMTSQARKFASSLSQTMEALDLLRVRFERDQQMMADLAALPDSAAALGVVTAFCRRSFGDYAAEAGRMSDQIAQCADQIGEGMQDDAATLLAGLNELQRRA